MFQDITIEQLLEMRKTKDVALVDVRSPSEYEDMTIPGSVNIPLFDDDERAVIGTLYKQQGIGAAKRKGLEIVSRKLPDFIRRFEELPGNKAVFCWRGGMRSKTATTLADLYGIRAYRLQGGIRAYRRWVVATLERFELRPPVALVNGYTGTGKTALLRELAREGYPVLDLERLAGHRGSIFGHIGVQPNNQKTFESLLVHELLALNDAPVILMEAESRRIGKAVLPEFLIAAKAAPQFFIELPTAERVKNILEDYRPELHHDRCLEAFERIRRRIHTPVAAEIGELLRDRRYPEAVALLLEHYYDRWYEHATQEYAREIVRVRAADSRDALERIKRLLRERFPELAKYRQRQPAVR